MYPGADVGSVSLFSCSHDPGITPAGILELLPESWFFHSGWRWAWGWRRDVDNQWPYPAALRFSSWCSCLCLWKLVLSLYICVVNKRNHLLSFGHSQGKRCESWNLSRGGQIRKQILWRQQAVFWPSPVGYIYYWDEWQRHLLGCRWKHGAPGMASLASLYDWWSSNNKTTYCS